MGGGGRIDKARSIIHFQSEKLSFLGSGNIPEKEKGKNNCCSAQDFFLFLGKKKKKQWGDTGLRRDLRNVVWLQWLVFKFKPLKEIIIKFAVQDASVMNQLSLNDQVFSIVQCLVNPLQNPRNLFSSECIFSYELSFG